MTNTHAAVLPSNAMLCENWNQCSPSSTFLQMEDELDESQKLKTALRQSMPLEDFEDIKGKVCTEKPQASEMKAHTPAYSLAG